MSELRNKILASDDIETELIEVEKWGVKIEIKGMSGLHRAQFLQGFSKEDGSVDYERLYPFLVIATAYDPDTGEKIFSDDDVPALNQKSGKVLETLGQAALKLSGMGADSIAQEGKGSSSTPNGGSTSP